MRLLSGVSCRTILLLLVGLLSMPVQVDALGFGALVLDSHLNQRLKADIPMLLNASDDMKNVQITLATPQEYSQLGLQWRQSLSRIRVMIHAKHSNQPIIQLRSIAVIRAPMLSILLKARKSGRGTYFKHYQLLFDPVETLLRASQQRAETTLATQSIQNDALAVPLPSAVLWARTWRYGPVQAGDSLSEIAYRLRVDKRFSNKQVMLSLYENNLPAFVDGNINHLIKGVWLTVPSDHAVKSFAGAAAMQKLSKLLQRENPTRSAATKTDANAGKAGSKPMAKADTKADPAASQRHTQQLRYSGKVSLQGVNAVATLKQDFDQQFAIIHQKMMAGKLQMGSLDQTVSHLNTSVQAVKRDIQRLQREIELLKMRPQTTTTDTLMTWPFAVIVLLLVLLGILVVVMLRKRTTADGSEHADSDDQLQQQSVQSDGQTDTQINETVASSSELSLDTVSTPLADEVIQLLNQTEESLGQCDFEQAEEILRQIDAKWPDSLKALALKAQLYHETDRHEERNALINSISEASDEQRWERFCYFLPSHVWNACFGDSTSPVDSQGKTSI